MSLIDARCTSCGAALKVDSRKDTGICEYCGSAFIIEKAVTQNNIIVNINQGDFSPSADNLVKRAKEFEKNKKYKEALDYYDKALDINNDCAEAREGIQRINDIYDKEILFTENNAKYIKAGGTLLGKRDKGTIALTRKKLTFSGKKETIVFETKKMNSIAAMEKPNEPGIGGITRLVRNCVLFHYGDDNKTNYWLWCGSGHAADLAKLANDCHYGRL